MTIASSRKKTVQKNAVAPAKAGAHHACPDRPTGVIGPSLRWGDELRTNSDDNCVILAIAVTQALPHHLPAISKKQGWLLTIKEMSLL
jgi:hypothetical protein